MTMHGWRWVWVVVAMLAACGSDDSADGTAADATVEDVAAIDGTDLGDTTTPADSETPADTEAPDDVGSDDTAAPEETESPTDNGAPDVPEPPECPGQKPLCAAGCGGDWFPEEADCIGGEWICPEGTVNPADCPPGTCWGLPTPGEICGDDGWECAPDEGDWAECHSFMCATCKGMETPMTVDGCTCACDGTNQVTCEPAPTTSTCDQTATSSLPEVSIHVAATECTFTLAQAAAGITIPYQVVVAADVEGVIPAPQDAGQCVTTGPGGLIVFEKLAGGGHSYCLCDTGLCMGASGEAITLTKGTFDAAFEWDGVNWFGPSDFGNPKGDPFPPGTYDLTISAKGAVKVGELETPYEVNSVVTITLVP